MIEKFIEAFKVVSNPKISNGEELKAWQGKAINTIVRVYGNDSIQEQQIKNVFFETYTTYYTARQNFGGGNNSELCQKQASEIINGFITDLSTFGLPQERIMEKSNGIHISVNQNQHQTIKLKIIFDSIKDELNGKQVKEVEEILNEALPSESKKVKLIEKLKSFGSDIVTNIVANILTNPAIYS